MAVNFTPNIGLAKPTETELAENWVNNTKLAEDNNLIIIDKMDITLTAYTPTIIAPTTNPNIGAGQSLGEYIEVQGFIMGAFNIMFTDPGVAAGTGTGGYGISLPTLVDNSFHTVGSALNNATGVNSCIGESYFQDESAIATSGPSALDVVRISGVDYARMMTETYVGKTVMYLGPGVPVTIANSDKLTGSFFYKKA